MPSYTELDEYTPTSMTTSERDTLWTSPPDTLTIFNTTVGLNQVYSGGRWNSIPNYVTVVETAAPTVNDDDSIGKNYVVGDRWLDVTNDNEFVCLDNSTGAAVWRSTTIFEDSYNGTFLEPFTFVVTEAGGVITGTLDKNPSGDMTERFSDGYSTATSGISIALTAGSDTAPTLNYVYILQSNKGVLAKSTTGWPAAEHNKIAQVILQTAATTQTEGGALVNQFWNDFTKDAAGQGHHTHAWERLRHEHSAYDSGGAITWTITTNVGTPDNVDVAVTAAKVYQLHLQDFEAKDTAGADNAHVVNDSVSPYTEITDFADLLTDSAGGSMSGRYFNLVLWGSISSGSEKEHLFVNLPGGSYNKQGDAIADVSGFTVYDIPSDFRGKAFLISRITLRHQAASGGTWTNIQAISLRGQVPNIIAGGGTAAITTEFADNQFKIFDDGDPTKVLAFQVSGVSASTTRTVTVPDEDVTLIDDGTSDPLVTGAAAADGTEGSLARKDHVHPYSAAHGVTHNAVHGISKHTGHANWKVLYTDGSGDEQELALSAAGGILESQSASSAPVFTIPKRSFQFLAESLFPNITAPCADVVQVETAGQGKNYTTRSFALNEQASKGVELPPNYDGGTVTWWYKFVTPASSSAGDTIIMGLRAGATKDDESLDVAFGTVVNITYTLPTPTAAGDLAVSAESAALTIASSGTAAGGDFVVFEIERTGGDMDEEVPLLMFYVRFGTNNASDE